MNILKKIALKEDHIYLSSFFDHLSTGLYTMQSIASWTFDGTTASDKSCLSGNPMDRKVLFSQLATAIYME